MLYVRDGKATKNFVWLSQRGSELVVETGLWGEKGTRKTKKYASKADASAALATQRQAVERKKFRQLVIGEEV